MNTLTMIKGQICTDTTHGMGAVSCDLSMAFWADQRTYVMLTRHIIAIIVVVNQTFLHFGVKQCADVSEQGPQLGADQRTQTHCDDVSIHGDSVSDEITQLTHVAPHGNLTQNDGYLHTTTTPWEVRAKLIGSAGVSYKRTTHFDPQSLNNYTQPPKSLNKSVEMLPKIHLLLLVDHTQSVKPLHVSEEKSNEDTLSSPYQAHDTGARNDTWGKCPWLPHHNQCPEVHGKLHGILLEIKDKKRKTLGDSFLKRKETGIKDL